jgi:hypothetical protein
LRFSKGSDADEDVLEPDGVGGDAVASKGLPRGRQNEGFDIIAVSAGPARSGCCVTGQAGYAQIKAALEANGRDREAFRFAAYFTCLLHEDEAMLDRALDHDLSRWHATIWGRINQSDWEREGVSAPMGADWHYAEKLLPVTYREADVAEMIGHATRASNG